MVTSINSINKVDCVIIAVTHDAVKKITSGELKNIMNDDPILIDVRGFFDEQEINEKRIHYRTLYQVDRQVY